jgi:UDP-N-acetylglucosamine 4-epimerase
LVNELYADVFSRVYGLHTVGLRYFNIFGPKQNPNNPYAAVIPIFCKHFLENTKVTINGDGKTSRDFTFVENAINANIKTLLLGEFEKHEVMNVACGDQISLNEIVDLLKNITQKTIQTNYAPERKGDVRHSKASIEKIMKLINYVPKIKFREGLEITIDWYKKNSKFK